MVIMSSSSTSAMALVCAIALAMSFTSHSQNTPQDFLDAHNSARADVGVGPVTWNRRVAAYAEDYAQKRIADCKLIHSSGPYGENIYWGMGKNTTAAAAFELWVEEKKYYDHASNTCKGGECRHYTQVVWRSSTNIGCARVNCLNGETFVICSYDPPGNYEGERPY